MRTVIFIAALFLVSLYSAGQQRKDLAVSVSGGFFNSPYYKKASAKGFYSFEFDYYLNRKQLLAVNYTTGNHRYYDDVLSNSQGGLWLKDGTNAHAEYRTFSVLYRYKILDNALWSLVPGAGAGIMTHTREFPYEEVNRAYPKISSWSDLVFPVSLDANFKISKHWQAGLTGGFLIHPDYPVLGLHAGPKLSYIIK